MRNRKKIRSNRTVRPTPPSRETMCGGGGTPTPTPLVSDSLILICLKIKEIDLKPKKKEKFMRGRAPCENLGFFLLKINHIFSRRNLKKKKRFRSRFQIKKTVRKELFIDGAKRRGKKIGGYKIDKKCIRKWQRRKALLGSTERGAPLELGTYQRKA